MMVAGGVKGVWFCWNKGSRMVWSCIAWFGEMLVIELMAVRKACWTVIVVVCEGLELLFTSAGEAGVGVGTVGACFGWMVVYTSGGGIEVLGTSGGKAQRPWPWVNGFVAALGPPWVGSGRSCGKGLA
jgi:hypothetical protein